MFPQKCIMWTQVSKKLCFQVFVRQFSSDCLTSSELILSNTVLKRSQLVPEISLHLMSPELEVWNSPYEKSPFRSDPFWGIFWPGGQALCRYLLDHRDVVAGKRIFVLGCGSGAEAISALKAGADRPVTCNDIDELALESVLLNSQSNGFLPIDVNLVSHNLLDDDLQKNSIRCAEKYDVLLVGDLFYDEDVGNKVIDFMKTFVSTECANKKIVFLGDPGRCYFSSIKRVDLRCLASYHLPKCVKEENHGFTRSHVFTVFSDK